MDIERTKQFYRELKQSDLCGCAYCRNYVKEAAKAYPAVTAYLQTLGVDIAKPFETMPLELDEDGRMPYIGPQYLVFGAEAGFAAATYQRGIPFVQVPTTLLAAVDSSVGGKTAVNLDSGKNQVGCFYQPSLVLCDPDTLRTLPPEEYRNGCAEVIKYAVLRSEPFFDALRAEPVSAQVEHVIATCVGMKRDLVAADEFDRGSRQLLNLGHSFGHAVEKCSDYAVPHGCGVAIGMAIIARAAAKRGICTDDTCAQILALLRQYGLPTETAFTRDALTDAARSDKKIADGKLHLIVPECIGRCRIETIPAVDIPAWLADGGIA